MILKHKRKYFLHIQILRYLKQNFTIEETLLKMQKAIPTIHNYSSECSTTTEWINILSSFKNFEELSCILLKKTDHAELLRHTSYLGLIIPDEEILNFKLKWFAFEKKWIKNDI